MVLRWQIVLLACLWLSSVGEDVPDEESPVSPEPVDGELQAEEDEDEDAKGGNGLPDPERMKKAMAKGEQMMEDPKMKEQMKIAETVMASQEMKEKLESLQSDPELKGMFEEIKGGDFSGMIASMQKYMQDPEFLKKLGNKMGDLPSTVLEDAGLKEKDGPKADNLLDATRQGHTKAVLELVAKGQDVNEVDAEARSPLHFAAGAGHMEVVTALLTARADTALADAQGSTPLLFAAGYGHIDISLSLLEAGATATRNKNGQSPADVARLTSTNPVAADAALLARLEVRGRASQEL
eukprot:gnl/TRDRNA2_/TRDRNA2_40750_c0_seq1.p1 gnl/TRDRNA2_/TRDRNA2_40750_c0~~gnl/TRDRNA2_/TRDRNA2_40750_c0_seq1.p1  ORF type:complete len:295 (+),score=88.16 gnl/TRDRNA2_/TRDRNA2_40750_c0_seq1:105-989(+)